MFRLVHTFRKDERGAIMVFFAMSIVVFIGFFAMVFDMGRVSATQSEMQAFADNVALAAAGELNGEPDAITRAQLAAANFVTGRQSFGNGSNTLSGGDFTLQFLSGLPASDTASLTPFLTNTAGNAYFAWVTVTPRTTAMQYMTALQGILNPGAGASTANLGAVAVAGAGTEACDVTPLMFCLPNPNYTAEGNVGDMIRLRSGGVGAAWGPGNFGFLDVDGSALGSQCSGLTGAQRTRCLVAADLNRAQCFSNRGVDTKPGQTVGIYDAALNVRFDIYKQNFSGDSNNSDYAPAPNVLKGIVSGGGGGNNNGNGNNGNGNNGNNGNGGGANQCIGQNESTAGTVPLPRDDCFYTSSCANGRIGDGDWDAELPNYMLTNHSKSGITSISQLPGEFNYLGVPLEYHGTRYGLYLAEIASASGGSITNPDPALASAETGLPTCSPHNAPSGPARRVITAAGIDCAANPLSGNETNVPVAEYFTMFLTEPVGDDGGSPATIDIWVEVLDSAGGNGLGGTGNQGAFREYVQLFR